MDLHDTSVSDDKDDVDSLPSLSTSEIYSDADSEAQAEWERSLEQLQLVLTMMIVPWVGKYFGRKFAFWSMTASRLPSFRSWLADDELFATHRLGSVPGMDARRRGAVDKQEVIQGRGRHRDGRNTLERMPRRRGALLGTVDAEATNLTEASKTNVGARGRADTWVADSDDS